MTAVSVQATFCATLVDEWARAGVRLAVVAPGSRSTPLALALAADGRLDLQVHHDERCAAFMALGAGAASGVPAVVLCTSGTAATHLHAAVVEAHHARVPLIACTADRPPELRDVGAPQAIDQDRLFGPAVRWFFDPGPPDEAMRPAWRSIAARAVREAAAGGPVHLNLPFREPLLGEPGELPPGRAGGAPWLTAPAGGGDRVAPATAGGEPVTARALAVGPGPVPGSVHLPTGLRRPPGAVLHADALLRVAALRDELRPELVLRRGRLPASRVVNEWLAASGADEHVLDGVWNDPYHTTRVVGVGPPPAVVAPPGWLERWRALDGAAGAAIATVLADHPEPTEPATARTLWDRVPAGGHLVVASSMPIRDLEWYAGARADARLLSNRGANGIDGTISTAVGVARAAGGPVACLLGDIAFLHDSNALVGLADRGVDLVIVVVDNDGGGIFGFLPQASALPPERFEQLFGTPHGVRPEALAAAHGLTATTVDAAAALAPALDAAFGAGGVHLVVVRTDRAANVRLHDELHAAVAAAVASL